MTQRHGSGGSVKFHGITSVAFAGIAICLGIIAIFQSSTWIGIGYLLFCPIAMAVVLYGYCAKCPCKANCAHVLPGKAAALFNRRPGPYSTAELTAMCASLLLLVGIPQLFLWRYPVLLAAFWVLFGIALVQIRGVICRVCDNRYCPLNSPNRP
jgi:hypothetical protein